MDRANDPEVSTQFDREYIVLSVLQIADRTILLLQII